MVKESQNIVSKLNKDLAGYNLSVTEYTRQPSELISLSDNDKVEIIRKVVKTMYVERLGKFKYKLSVIPTEMIAPLVLDNECYIYYGLPNANKLEVVYKNNNEVEVRDITNIIIRRHERKKYGKH